MQDLFTPATFMPDVFTPIERTIRLFIEVGSIGEFWQR